MGANGSRVRIRTGLDLSSEATWIGRISRACGSGRRRARQDPRGRGPAETRQESRRPARRLRVACRVREHGQPPQPGCVPLPNQPADRRSRRAPQEGAPRSACSSHYGSKTVPEAWIPPPGRYGVVLVLSLKCMRCRSGNDPAAISSGSPSRLDIAVQNSAASSASTQPRDAGLMLSREPTAGVEKSRLRSMGPTAPAARSPR